MGGVLSDSTDLRQTYRARRTALAPALRQAAQQRVYQSLDQFKRLRKAHTIAAFVATNGELDLQPWFNPCSMHKTIVLPVIANQPGDCAMAFHEYRQGDAMVRNRYGIAEPHPEAPLHSRKNIDVMLMPLVAFDASGTRLGMGGGYYDRYLAKTKHRPYLLGVAFACQQAQVLPRNDWDVPLDAVVTEEGVLEFSH